MLLLVYFLSQKKPMSDAVGTLEIHSLSKMMLAFVVLWTYVSYGQYIIIWSGNIPEFTPWYIHRTEEGWSLLALALILFYFAVPFFLLLSRRLKQNLSLVWGVAILVLVMRMVEIFWLIAPDFYTSGFTFDPMYIGAHLLLGGIWLTSFVWMLKRRPLLPANELRKDPRVQEGHAHA
jgi:peptidoglycan/LPS O-acetylase OafA/YrhL